MTSSWLEQNLLSFKDASIKEQLESILGEKDADQFLNPTIQEKTHRSTIQNMIKRTSGTVGAHALWYSLRSSSNNRLMKNSKPVQKCYIVTPTVNDEALKKVEGYRHKVELMHRVAHLNEVKTNKILNYVKLPTISGDLVDNTGPQQFYVESQLKNKLPAITHPTVKDSRSSQATKSNESLRFLSDSDNLEGKFRQRMKKLGVESSLGLMQHIQPPTREKILEESFRRKCSSYQEISPSQMREEANKCKGKKKSLYSRSWRPLSVHALAEYTATMPVLKEKSSLSHENEDENIELPAD